jgi:nucleoside-diphosphate-sugar epimerase
MMQKLMDSSIAQSFGWKVYTDIRDGIQNTYNSFLNNKDN